MTKYRIVYKQGWTGMFYYVQYRNWLGFWRQSSLHCSLGYAKAALESLKSKGVVYEE